MGTKRHWEVEYISTQGVEWNGFDQPDHYDGEYQRHETHHRELQLVSEY